MNANVVERGLLYAENIVDVKLRSVVGKSCATVRCILHVPIALEGINSKKSPSTHLGEACEEDRCATLTHTELCEIALCMIGEKLQQQRVIDDLRPRKCQH